MNPMMYSIWITYYATSKRLVAESKCRNSTRGLGVRMNKDEKNREVFLQTSFQKHLDVKQTQIIIHYNNEYQRIPSYICHLTSCLC